MSLDELRALVKNGELKEDVFRELVRINSSTENSTSSASLASTESPTPRTRSSPALVPSLAAKITRPLSRALNGGETAIGNSSSQDLVVSIAEGWLFARQPGKESWKRRYVTLSYTRLEWFNTNEVKARKLKGEATLSGSLTVKRLEDDVLSFALFSNGKQVFDVEFSADSEADVRRWLSELTRVLSLLRAASGKDLPVLLNRPTRSESQVTRDFHAREHAAKQFAVSTALATGGSLREIDVALDDEKDERTVSVSPTEEEKRDDADGSSSYDATVPQTRMEQVAAVSDEVAELKREALAKIRTTESDIEAKKQVLNGLKEQFVELHEKEPSLNSTLAKARANESHAFDEVNRLRKEEKQSAERVSLLYQQEVTSIKALEVYKNLNGGTSERASSSGTQGTTTPQAHSKALQRLLMKDGIKVEVDPQAERLSELNLQVQATRKTLQTEKDRLKRLEGDRAKAESTLKHARAQVAEVIRQQQDLAKAKRTLQQHVSEESRALDALMLHKKALEEALVGL